LRTRQKGIADAGKLLADKRKARVERKAFKVLRFGISKEPKQFIPRRIGTGMISELPPATQILTKKGWDELLRRLSGPSHTTPLVIVPRHHQVTSIHGNPHDNSRPARERGSSGAAAHHFVLVECWQKCW
jgi:hypothetical protein